jgi:integrase
VPVRRPKAKTRTKTVVRLTAKGIESYNSCILWLDLIKTEHSRKNFTLHLSMFCRFTNTDPDEMLTWTNEQAQHKVLEYIVHLKKNAKQKAEKPKAGEISVNSLRTYLGGVQSFFVFHDKMINWKKLFKYLPEKVTSKLRAYTREEIKRLLEFADPRDRAIILIMASGGPRRGAFPTMKIGDVVTLCEEPKIGMLRVYPDSDKDHYVTLLTPECMDAIEKYKNWRKANGEALTDSSPLIRDKFDVGTKHRNEPKPLSEASIHAQVVRVSRKAGVYSEDLAPDHSFRYWFNTALMNSDVNQQFKELMMGHSIKLDDVYFKAETKASRQKILTEYLKAVEALTISEAYSQKKLVESLKGELANAAPKGLVADLTMTNKALMEKVAKMEEDNKRRDAMMANWIKGKVEPDPNPQS